MATPAEAAIARQEELAHQIKNEDSIIYFGDFSDCRRFCVGMPVGAKDEPEVTAMEVHAGAELFCDDFWAFFDW